MYGDIDPDHCTNLMSDDKGPAHCYDAVTKSQCCGTCEQVKNTTIPSQYPLLVVVVIVDDEDFIVVLGQVTQTSGRRHMFEI